MQTLQRANARILFILLMLLLWTIPLKAAPPDGESCSAALVAAGLEVQDSEALRTFQRVTAMIPFNSNYAPSYGDEDTILNLFVADPDSHTLQWLQQAHPGAPMVRTTLAGVPNQAGYVDTAEANTSPLFNAPEGLTRDLDGTLYVADTGNRVIRRIYSNGFVETLFRRPDGESEFRRPRGLAFGFLSNKRKLAVADEEADAVHILDLDEGLPTVSLRFHRPTRVDWWGKSGEIGSGVWGSLIVADAEGIHQVLAAGTEEAIVDKISEVTATSLFIAEGGNVYFITSQNTVEWIEYDDSWEYQYLGPLTWCGAPLQSPSAIGLYFGWLMVGDVQGDGGRIIRLDVNTEEGRKRLADNKIPNATCDRCGPGRPQYY